MAAKIVKKTTLVDTATVTIIVFAMDFCPIGSYDKYLGITNPISLNHPEKEDIAKTVDLVKSLEVLEYFEEELDVVHRMHVLVILNQLVSNWIKDVSIEKNVQISFKTVVRSHVYTFGSYRLGVHKKGADIDVLCIVPRHIHREDYFDSFYSLLQQQPEVAELRAIADAYVPVIKMVYDGIDIDMTFVRLAVKEVTNNISFSDPLLLKNLDTKCSRSLNGLLVTDEILNQVPNEDTFRLTLRAIRLWAESHGIYSNVLGYLGGVSWAILVARVCQLYPNACSATLLQKFFLVFLEWQWPQPVILKNSDKILDLGLPVWDPHQNVRDRLHVMPILTPAYPQQNSAFNVSRSTLKLMKEEFRLSLSICENIIYGKATWNQLFDIPNFFAKYQHYIVLEASSLTEDDQIQWYGHVESKIRHLVNNLEREALQLAHVFPKFYPSCEKGKEKTTNYWFIGLMLKGKRKRTKEKNALAKGQYPANQCKYSFNSSTSPICTEPSRVKSLNGLLIKPLPALTDEALSRAQINVDITTPINVFCELVKRSAVAIKMWKDGMCLEAYYRKRKQLRKYLPSHERNNLKADKKYIPITAYTPRMGTSLSKPNTPYENTDAGSSTSVT